MAEEIEKDLTDIPAEPVKKELTVEQIMAELENVKKAQAGTDKKYQETAKELTKAKADLEKERLEKMTEKEKADHLLAEKEKVLTSREKEVQVATLRLLAKDALSAKQMDSTFEEFVMGENEEAITEKISKLDALIKIEVGRRVEETLSGTKKPKTGDPVAPQGQPKDLGGLSFQDLEKQIRTSLKI